MSYILQSATAQAEKAAATLTLATTPTVGNTLVLLVAGWSGTPNVPSGFTFRYGASDLSNQSINVWSRVVQSGDGTTYTAPASSDRYCFLLMEAPGTPTLTYNHGAASASGNTYSTSALTAVPTPSYRVLAWEADARPWAVNSRTFVGETDFGTPFQSDSTIKYHGATVNGGRATSSGVQSITADRSLASPVWGDLVISGTPMLVQSAKGVGYASSVNLVLPSAPTVGNTLVLMVGGYANTVTPPSGFAQYDYANDSDKQAVSVFSRTVQSGDGASWTAPAVQDMHDYLLVEMLGPVSLTWQHGAATANGNTYSTTSLTGTDGQYRLTMFEADNRGWSSTAGYDFDTDFGSPFQATDIAGYHGAYVTGGPATPGGVQSITTSSTLDRPMWASLVMTSTTSSTASTKTSVGSASGSSTVNGTGSSTSTNATKTAAGTAYGTSSVAGSGSSYGRAASGGLLPGGGETSQGTASGTFAGGGAMPVGPQITVVEIDAYLPATGTAGLAQDAWGAFPWGALSRLSYSLESYTTTLVSDVGYRTSPSDGVQVYPPGLQSGFQISRSLQLDPTQQAAGAGWGSVTLSNVDGRYNNLAARQNSDGRGIRIYIGNKVPDPARGYYMDPPRSGLRTLFVGMAKNWFLSDTTLSVPLRDGSYWIERSVQTALYGGAGGLDGSSDLTGQVKPRTRGVVSNIAPILIDSTNRIYQWTDAGGSINALYEGGAATITYQGDVSDLYSGSTTAGQYRTNNARGLFQLGSTAVKQITIDATAYKTSSMSSATGIGDLLRGLLIDDLAVPTAYLDTSGLSNFASTATQPGGYYLTSQTDGATLAGQIAASVAAQIYPRRDGRLSVWLLRALSTSATPVATFDRTVSVSCVPATLSAPLDPPPYRWQVGYGHVYTVQTTDLSGSITAARKLLVAVADRFAVQQASAIVTAYRRPSDPSQIVTMLQNASDAGTIAGALVNLWSVRRRLYTVTVPTAIGLAREIGDVVRLTWPLDDLSGGKLGQIVGDKYSGGDATISFTVLV